MSTESLFPEKFRRFLSETDWFEFHFVVHDKNIRSTGRRRFHHVLYLSNAFLLNTASHLVSHE